MIGSSLPHNNDQSAPAFSVLQHPNDPAVGCQGVQGAELSVKGPPNPVQVMTVPRGAISNQHVDRAGQLSDRGNTTLPFDGLSFDALFGSHYDSGQDEDYSIKEDLIQNTKTYRDDFKPFKQNVSKAEIAYLTRGTRHKYDSLLFLG